MRGPRKRFLVGVVLAAWSACGGGGSEPPPRDANEPGPSPDLTFEDTCQCGTAADCAGKVETGPCVEAACNACACEARNKAAGTACDDGQADTIHDACDGTGVCKGVPVSCGNGQCEATEHCGNCLQDCPCGDQQVCKNNQCVTAVCGNGQCEPPVEDCASCIPDCGCQAGQTCHQKACLTCADYCKDTGKECGKPAGTTCDCGDCPQGQACDGFHRCYGATICGNHVCEVGEDCTTCEADCGCEKRKKCVSGQCQDCAPICQTAGRECGFYEGCDCGSCAVCYKCSAQNQCVPKCDCVCWQKQCGEVDGCQCGPLGGGCPAGQECVGYKCLAGCDTLCQGIACGWAEDCICGFCEGCDACHDHHCGLGAGIDPYDVYPYNDTWENATDLGQTTDSDLDSARKIQGTIDVDFDHDWYKIEVSDVSGSILDPHFELTGLAEDKDLDLEVCYKCKSGATLGLAATPADSVIKTESTIPGAKCFASINLWGQDERMDLKMLTCEGGSQDGSGTVYVHILPVVGEDCGSGYTLTFHM